MTRFSHTASRRHFQIVALFLVYSLSISLWILPNHHNVQASLIRRNTVFRDKGIPSPTPSSSPEPSASPSPVTSPTPDPSTSPTPEPAPTMTPTTAPTPTQGVPVQDMPNLDGLRYAQPSVPEVPEEVPSTRCSPGQPDCNPTTGNPDPSSQALYWERGRPARTASAKREPLPQDQMLAWTDKKFSSPFLKYDASREATDTSVRTDALFSLLEPPTGGSYDDFVMARLDPDNRIGTGGEDILSRNFNWSLPLVGMAGRAGLNFGLSLSYNSLVWTRSGNYITYDADNGFPTPGFRLGFPVVYGQHYNSQTGTYGYLMLMPSGGRVELRQVGSTNVYEAADSSYLQLIDNEDGTLLVRSTDGTQLSYESTGNGFRCSQVKDRNGNYLSITNNEKGRMESVTDTLGRVFNFNYDEKNNLTSISQTRGGGQYTWATFGYTNLTLQTNFTGLTTIGTPGGRARPALTQVGLPDGTYYKFSYNSWGQVYKITNYAADSSPDYDNHALNYVSYNLPLTSSTALTDCPRFTQRKDWAENWNNNAEAVTNYAVPSTQTWTMPGGSQQTGTFCQIQTPDGVYQNVYLHSSGWDEGMVVLVNTYDQQIALQRQATTAYTQDNTGVSYILNPRVTESNIYDPSGNHKRTSISYSTSFGLPVEVKEYAADATSVLRTSKTVYNLSSDYTNRRIIGLPSQRLVCDASDCEHPVSKVDFSYDDSGEFLVQQGSPIQHDASNYGSSFTWRGNLTKVKRWDVINTSQSVESIIGYNTTGAPIFTRSPLQTSDTQANLIYTDSFSDGQNRNTYAYPTESSIKDTVGSSSSLVPISNKSQYSFDTGAATRVEGPPPAGQSQGAIITNAYDSADRIYQLTNAVNGAYVYIVYPTSSNVVQTYTTIQNAQSTTVSAKLLDGAGRVRAVAAEHPGSTGGYVGQYFVYDAMGRQIQQTNPTEIYGSWQPAGDDAVGWNWRAQTYDWKGRPRVSTNQDGTTRETTYGGCGCAGGEIVTLRDEGTLINGVVTKRQQKVHADVLGRVWKTEDYNWSGGSLYRSTTNNYNALDQVISVVTQDANSSTSQTTSMTYDGYGRVATRHVPIQSIGTSSIYNYNNDDTLQTTKDARGVTATFTYNNRQLVTGVSYAVPTPSPSPAVTSTAPSTFRYDKAGNRIETIDGTGNTTYQYDQLSRLTSETRHFNDITTRDFTLSYAYNISGGLTGMTDPFGGNTNYLYDSTGRLNRVTGSGLGVSEYISQIDFRAWGDPKRVLYGNTLNVKWSYNKRLAVSHYEGLLGTTVKIGADYQYDTDGSLRFSDDMTDPKLDRSYKYDHVGRIKEARSGAEARNEPATDDRPYNQTYFHDSWDNATGRAARHWTEDVSFAGLFVNNRNANYQYDADGRYVGQEHLNGYTGIAYDAAGQRTAEAETTFTEEGTTSIATLRQYDGDGQMVSEHPSIYCNTCPPPTSNSSFYIRSSVLGGQPVAAVTQQGNWFLRYVYANGELIARAGDANVGYPAFEWRHIDPSGSGILKSYPLFGTDIYVERTELDPVGADVGTENPYTGGGGGGGGNPNSGDLTSRLADAHDFSRCSRDEMLMPCAMIFREGVEDTIDGIGHERRFVPIRYRDKDNPKKIRYGLGSRKRLRSGKWAYVPVGKVNWELDDYVVFRFPDGATGEGYVPMASNPFGVVSMRSKSPAATAIETIDIPAETERLFRDCLKIVNAHLTDRLADDIRMNNRSNQPLALLIAHAAVESTLGTSLVGLDGELGLFQLKMSTARSSSAEKFTNKQLRDDFALNTRIASSYLQKQIDKFGGFVRSGLAAYKQGTSGVKRNGLTAESEIYADAIQKCAQSIQR